MEPAELHRRGVERSTSVVDGIAADQWGRATPCDEWDVRALVNHLTVENRWVPRLLDGARVEDVGDELSGDLLGDDPVATHHDAAGAAQTAAEQVDPERTVHLSFGDVTAGFFLQQRATDMIVHSWDLAVATGQQADLDEGLAAELLALNEPMITPEVREAGVFGPAVPVPDDATASERLLGLLGRDPGRGE